MKKEISILIVQNNQNLGKALATYIKEQNTMEVISIDKENLDAVDMLANMLLSAIIADVIKPYLAEMGELEKINIIKSNKEPIGILLSVFIKEHKDLELYDIKPSDIESLIKKFEQLNLPKSPNNIKLPKDNTKSLETVVTNLLHEMGIPTNLKGYKYLKEAIIMNINNTNIIYKMTKKLYPQIANKFHTTSSRVEHAIRSAIETAWERGDQKIIENIFAYTISSQKGKPTNSEFISIIAEKIRLELKLPQNI